MENILGSQLRGITVWKTCTYAGGKVSYTMDVEAGFEVYADYAVCNLFIHVI